MSLAKKLLYCSAAVVIVSGVWQWANYVDVEGTCSPLLAREECRTMLLSAEFYAGKRVILTGASRGIGKGLAIRLAQLGAKYVYS